MSVVEVAQLVGVSNSGLYVAIKAGTSPFKFVKVGNRIRVLTWSVIEVLEGK